VSFIWARIPDCQKIRILAGVDEVIGECPATAAVASMTAGKVAATLNQAYWFHPSLKKAKQIMA